jgi:hypothetical protein
MKFIFRKIKIEKKREKELAVNLKKTEHKQLLSLPRGYPK